MTASERARHIWPILVLCASRRETVTYALLGQLIGVPARGLAQLLEPIESYCSLQGLAPLTSIVVKKARRRPQDGLTGKSNLSLAHADVYAQDWLRDGPPDAGLLYAASEGMLVRHARERQEARAARAAKNRPAPGARETKRKILGFEAG